ncbi:MAG: hypothetical protein AB7P76_11525 [Candidatus Melainabacteria bacterium]
MLPVGFWTNEPGRAQKLEGNRWSQAVMFGQTGEITDDRFERRGPQPVTPGEFARLLTDRIDAGEKLLLAFDVDGTLVPFHREVKDARMTAGESGRFVRLAQLTQQRFGTPLSVITGRAFDDVLEGLGGESVLKGQPVVIVTDQGLRNFDCATWHEITTPETAPLTEKAKALHDALRPFMETVANADNGFVNPEYKAGGIAINTASASPDLTAQASEKFLAVGRELGLLPADTEALGQSGEFTLVHENAALEMKPRTFNKGNAMRGLKEAYLKDGGVSFFVGDAPTDNAALSEADYSLFVGKPVRPVTAKYMLPNEKHTEGADCETPDGQVDHEKRTAISRQNTEAVHAMLADLMQHLERKAP